MPRFSVILFSLLFAGTSFGQAHHSFQVGESLTYSIAYQLMGVWIGAGEVTFSVQETSFLGHECYQFKGVGKTYERYNWFYEVEDTYSAYADKDDLKPYRFFRDVSEGSFYFREENLFDYNKERVYSVLKVKEKPVKVDTHPLPPNVFDVLTLIYYSRGLDYENYEIGQKIPINMFIDRKSHDLFLRFLGTEIYKHSELGEVECYVFSPLLVDGTIFKPGEGMKVWVTKDENLIPLFVESEIRVGTIRSELVGYKGLRFPLKGN